jgi:membrane dipeptidase
MLLFDAHLDLAMNALEWNRDLSRGIAEIREREQKHRDKPDRGGSTVCFPEMRRGGVGVCVATQIARFVKPGNPLPGWHSPAQAWAHTQGQLAWYRGMEEAGELAPITNGRQLETHLALWTRALANPGGASLPIGYILSLEGADSLVTLGHLERAYEQGLRAVGPAHYGPGTYAQGTESAGGLGTAGRQLLAEMSRLGMILDVTHLCDESFDEALDNFEGRIWASHSNCRALVPHHRQFSDDQIRCLVARDAVIGVALDAWMLTPNWVRGTSTPESAKLKLDHVIDHVDHICQLAGNAHHAGIGSDLDGGFGREQTPTDLQTIADVARVPELLRGRGYSANDVQAVAHGNFINFLRRAWT